MTRLRRVRAGTVRAGELVRAVLARHGVEAAVREHRLVTEWETIVGPRVAARAWPDGLKHGVLYVRVTNSAWLHELGFLREALVREANRAVGDPPLVKEIRLHLGSRRPTSTEESDLVAALAAQRRAKPAPKPRRVPSTGDLARIDREAAAVRDPDLAAVIRDVRRRLGL